MMEELLLKGKIMEEFVLLLLFRSYTLLMFSSKYFDTVLLPEQSCSH